VAINHQPPAETFVGGVTMMAKIRRIGKHPASLKNPLALRSKN
jgi:hypothetical protein